MGKKLDLNYFTGQEADQFNFVKIPKPLLYDPAYADLKIAEVITYSMMLDRMSLSIKNGWFDELGRAYIFCSLNDVREFADCGKNKAVEIMKALEDIGLIEKVKGAPGAGTRIYVKNFIPRDSQKFENQTLEAQKFENQTSKSLENKLLEVWKSNPSNNKLINTKNNNTKSFHIISSEIDSETQEDRCDEDEIGYAELVKENICLDTLLERYPDDRELIQGMYDLILEMMLSTSEYTVIASCKYSTNFVRGKLLKLDHMHIEYVLECMKENSEKPRNIRKYLLAALFNAPSTIGAYYQAEVNHDMAKGVWDEALSN